MKRFTLLLLVLVSTTFLNMLQAHTVDYFTSCAYVCSGNTLNVSVHISNVNSATRYNWQYKDNSNTWKCFVNGSNTINGVAFTVSGVSATGVSTTGPVLSIANAQFALENVYVRLAMADNNSPCTSNPSFPIYGTDKSLQLHVLNASECANIGSYCSGNPYSTEMCWASTTGNPDVTAKMITTINKSAGTATIRVTFAKTLVDNTYGTNSIGWGGKGHLFKDLSNSDNLQMAVYNASKTKVLEFKLDYLSASSTVSSGYKSLGVSGGDGSMIVGSASNILDVNTSLDVNLNDYGYKLTTNSPATSASYSINPSYPNWIYDVWYEVKVKLSAFGTSGFGEASIVTVNASPSKTGNNSECLDAGTCASGTLNLGNLVWNDSNGNGIKDNDEHGISGATVKLYRDNNGDNSADGAAIATTTTSPNGAYNFSGLEAGKYIAGVVIPTGYTASLKNSATPDNNIDNDNNGVRVLSGELRSNFITLSVGGEPTNDGDGNNGNLTLDLALCGSGAIGDFVWNDKNNNGLQDAGEAGIANVTVTLTFPDGTIRTTTTDANGKYKFINLGPITHKVTFTTPAGFNASPSKVGTDDTKDSDPVNGSVTVKLAPNEVNNCVDAGFFSGAVSLGNLVWNDWNGNGIKEEGEPGVQGVTVRLYRDNNGDNKVDGSTISTTTTDKNGNYVFTNLVPGNYIVGIVVPTGYTITGSGFANPNDDRDNDNNGVNFINQTELRTNYITLVPGTEPGNDGDGSNSNQTLDLAICGSSALGDFVWNDYNNNGIQDAGEPGIADVAVTLTFPDGTTFTKNTDANGKYTFVNLGPGSYTIEFAAPVGFTESPDNEGTDDTKDSDPTDAIVKVTLAANTVNYTVDAGFSKPGVLTLGNLVWNDYNGNGIKEANEPGISGVTVKLYRDNNGNNVADGAAIATTVTSSTGTYKFTGLSDGKYIVGIIVPEGFTITGTNSSNPNDDKDNDNNGINYVNNNELRTNYITLVAGTEPTNDGDNNNGNLTLDLALCGNGTLGDFVWNDLNANGIQDAGEPGIPGITVTVQFPDDVTTATLTTDADGKYLLVNLGPGTYKVTFSTPANFIASPANQGSDDAKDSDPVNGVVLETLDVNEINLNIDAGFTRGAKILNLGNFVWNDFDGDGKKDPNEPGIGGITVSLYRDDNNDNLPDGAAIATAMTNTQGYYLFTGLTNGRYIASIPIIAGFQQSGSTTTSATPDNDVDNDNNAVNKVGQVVYTNAITLAAGTEPTNDGDGNNGNLTLDLALCGNSWIGDFVWNDINRNGIQDANEPGINGVEVRLTQPDGTIRTVVTYTDGIKGDGYYDFPRLGPGNYTVTFITPAGFTPSPANRGTDGAKDSDPVDGSVSLILAANESNFTIDAGFTPPGNLDLGNLVWNDTNGNGIRDKDEPGVGDVTVKLYRDDNNDNVADGAAIATTKTSAAGYYNFSGLNEGRYIVGLIIPSGYTITPTHFDNPDNNVDNDNNGTNVINQAELRSNAITLTDGNEPDTDVDGDDKNGNMTLDLAICGRSTIGDFVWFDYNNNGIQNAGEPGMSNVRVTLTYEEGTTKTVRTDANGKYSFVNLGPGTYTVKFTTPLGFTTSPANQGTDDTKDSDPVNEVVTVTLGLVETNLTIDAGYWDDVDRDNDGITNLEESHGYYPLRDCDDDGIPNYMDPTPGCPGLVWTDCNGDGINDFFDFDKDGIINELDLDSDNDGILDLQETRDPRAVDLNNDGMVDGVDNDGDGLLSTADTNDNLYGGPGLTPEDLDRDGQPNYLDLDSDGDGLTDLTEALEVFDTDGLVAGEDTDGDGVRENAGFNSNANNADNIIGFGAKGIQLKDRDNDGKPNPYDIDSDNDGISDNVEGQPTCSYIVPSGIDVDKDGLDDAYDTNIDACFPKAGGITPYDRDGDGTPDVYDLDTDNDGAPDINEGSGIYGNFVTQKGDADGDGMIDQFDIFNIKTATGNFTSNVLHSNMGTNGSLDGPNPAGSNAKLPKSTPGGCQQGVDRDWRDVRILAVTLVDFKGNLNNKQVNLSWTVTNESNMSYYSVQRSIDGSTFVEVGKVNAIANDKSTNTTYSFVDNVTNLTNATVYYKLKQVELTGSEKLSNVITFNLSSKAGYTLGVHPNPATDYFTVKVQSVKDGMAIIRITDFTGRIMLTQNTKLATGTNAITFNNLISMASGTYNVQVLINGEVLNERLVIAK